MVDIPKMDNDNTSGAGGDNQPPPQQEGSSAQGGSNTQASTASQRVMGLMSNNKVEAALWLTRISTIVFTVAFILPFLGNPSSCYQRALISNAATSALRLHQRLPNFQLSREFFGLLFLEDSAHYLFYSLIFVSNYPVTMVVVPVFLFALLHAQKYTKQILDAVGPGSMGLVRNLVSKLDTNQQNILRFIACNEIFLMPAIVFMLFMGQASLLLPFIYYRFLTLRYGSRRNPYCRQLFYELRVATESVCASASCPAFIRNLSFKVIGLVAKLAPATQPAQ